MSSPGAAYYAGTISPGRAQAVVEEQGIPHAMRMDLEGIVRFRGQPDYLEEQELERSITSYCR